MIYRQTFKVTLTVTYDGHEELLTPAIVKERGLDISSDIDTFVLTTKIDNVKQIGVARGRTQLFDT